MAGLSKAIQLSVAPMFLVTGVTGPLSLFSSRLARVIDRTCVIHEALAKSQAKQEVDVEDGTWLEQVLAVLFISAVAALGTTIVGLLLFLMEVQLAISQNLRRYD